MGALVLKAISKTGRDMLEKQPYDSVFDIPCGSLMDPENDQPISVHVQNK